MGKKTSQTDADLKPAEGQVKLYKEKREIVVNDNGDAVKVMERDGWTREKPKGK